MSPEKTPEKCLAGNFHFFCSRDQSFSSYDQAKGQPPSWAPALTLSTQDQSAPWVLTHFHIPETVQSRITCGSNIRKWAGYWVIQMSKYAWLLLTPLPASPWLLYPDSGQNNLWWEGSVQLRDSWSLSHCQEFAHNIWFFYPHPQEHFK